MNGQIIPSQPGQPALSAGPGRQKVGIKKQNVWTEIETMFRSNRMQSNQSNKQLCRNVNIPTRWKEEGVDSKIEK